MHAKKKSSEGTLVSEGYVAMVRAPRNNHCRFASLCRFTLSRASLSSKTTCVMKVKGFRTLGLPPRCLCLPCLFWAKEPGFVPRGSRHAREGPKGPAFCQGSTRARSMRSASRSLGLAARVNFEFQTNQSLCFELFISVEMLPRLNDPGSTGQCEAVSAALAMEGGRSRLPSPHPASLPLASQGTEA